MSLLGGGLGGLAGTALLGPLGGLVGGIFGSQQGNGAPAAPEDPYAGMPKGPNIVDPTTGRLASDLKITPETNANQASNQAGLQSAWAGLNPNTQGLEMYRQQATTVGPSAWANLATQQQQQGQQQQANNAVQQNAAGTAGAASNLAMTGGLSSGARERLALGGANAGNAAQQGIAAQGAQARTGILAQDAQNKQSMLANLPGMENQALQPGMAKANAWQSMAQNEAAQNQQNQQFNTANNMNAQNMNAQNNITQGMDQYKQQMASWAAGKQADATANSGKK